MTRISDLHKEWLKDPEYNAQFDALGPEFELMESLLRARMHAGLTQMQLAERMGTTQSAIARIESGRARPSTSTLERYAKATGSKLRIMLEVG